MSFGNYQYQHRFFNAPSTKRYQAQSVPYYPLIQQPLPSPISPSHYQAYEPVTNDLNLRVRGGTLRKNEPGWDGYRVKSYVTEKYSQDYRQNADMLQRFRRQAQELRRRKRFVPNYQQDSRFVYLPEVRRVITEPEQIYQQPPSPIIAHKESEQHNPEIVKQYDVGIMARMDELKQEREIVKSRLESMRDRGIIDEMKLHQYKRKYSKLKRKLKEEIMEKKLQGLVEQKRKLEDYNQRKHIDALEQLMTDISTKLNRNSQLLNESLKIKEQINKSTVHSRVSVDQRPRVQQNSIHYATRPAEDPSPPSSPTIVYKQRDLNSQYLQLERLNREARAIAKMNK